ncbi:unnamed protein product [Cyprideis torosa]|uniref:Sex-determining region Y protein n=1 Tax=Cyprideis torosa TaxID=163714 RepID=A0A7R8ZR53_9CRUS|nr:unnamed protein product [Cyprideis torosa]CAG0893499.1 unnamed protein product [Cyprideis torosa]
MDDFFKPELFASSSNNAIGSCNATSPSTSFESGKEGDLEELKSSYSVDQCNAGSCEPAPGEDGGEDRSEMDASVDSCSPSPGAAQEDPVREIIEGTKSTDSLKYIFRHTGIPRPPNAFMMFTFEWRKRLAGMDPNANNREISRRLGQMWKSMGVGEKGKYFQLAKMAAVEHRQKHPDYVYSPREARIRKALRQQGIRPSMLNNSRQLPRPQGISKKNRSQNSRKVQQQSVAHGGSGSDYLGDVESSEEYSSCQGFSAAGVNDTPFSSACSSGDLSNSFDPFGVGGVAPSVKTEQPSPKHEPADDPSYEDIMASMDLDLHNNMTNKSEASPSPMEGSITIPGYLSAPLPPTKVLPSNSPDSTTSECVFQEPMSFETTMLDAFSGADSMTSAGGNFAAAPSVACASTPCVDIFGTSDVVGEYQDPFHRLNFSPSEDSQILSTFEELDLPDEDVQTHAQLE